MTPRLVIRQQGCPGIPAGEDPMSSGVPSLSRFSPYRRSWSRPPRGTRVVARHMAHCAEVAGRNRRVTFWRAILSLTRKRLPPAVFAAIAAVIPASPAPITQTSDLPTVRRFRGGRKRRSRANGSRREGSEKAPAAHRRPASPGHRRFHSRES